MAATMTWTGIDVHARSSEAAAMDVLTGELIRQRFGPGVAPVVDWLGGLPAPVKACYEAGPTGFGLYRAACAAGIEMMVVAPGKTPRAAADRVKSDRKDAELLMRLLAAGSLKAIAVPSPEVEAARDLFRAREQVRGDLMRARHRVSKLLLRHGIVWPEPNGTWTQRHRRWLAGQRLDHSASQLALIDTLAAVDGLVCRKQALDERLSRLASSDELWPTIARLRAFRGIDTLTALGLHLELGADWQRFSRPRSLGAWLGLTPSLHQSGQTMTQGSITKTGSTYARRLLVEAAWHYARPPAIGVTLRNRQADLPDHILAIAWRAQHRLFALHRRLRARGKLGNVTVVAVARELACFCWAAATAP
jgi:transposase